MRPREPISTRPTAQRRQVEAILPLSAVQEGMLFHSLAEPAARVYVGQWSCRLEGPFDFAACRQSWERLVDRHEVLRTAFLWEDTRSPLQLVLEKVDVPLLVVDWRSLPAAERESRLGALLEADRRRGFELQQAPLLRLSLVRLADRTTVIVWTQHHGVIDGWSLALLFEELAASYAAFTSGREPLLATPQPFSSFLRWRERRSRAALNDDVWRQRLGGFREATPLPVGPPASEGTPGSGTRMRRLEGEAVAALEALAQRNPSTLGTLIQGAWGILLGRHSGRADVVFGVVVSGRPADFDGAEALVGLMINTLPLRLDVSPGVAIGSWLATLRRRQAELLAEQLTSLPEVQARSDVAPSRALFDSLVVYESYPAERALLAGFAGLRVSDVRSTSANHYALTLEVLPPEVLGGHLELRLRYDRRRFSISTVERLLRHVENLLRSMGQTSDGARLGELALLSLAERWQILGEWNPAVPRPYPPSLAELGGAPGPLHEAGLHELVAARALRVPEAVAVESSEGILSYGELLRRAEGLAAHLYELGVRAGDTVALDLRRTARWVVAALAVLRIGGTYVPLSSRMPPARLSGILELLAVPWVITERGRGAGFAGPARGQLVEYPAELRAAGPVQVAKGCSAAAAYILFTSGSTGTPRGVAVPHRAVTHLLAALAREVPIGPDDRGLCVNPLSFDLSVWDIFGLLSAGATLRLASDEEVEDPARRARILSREGVSVWNSAPTMLRQTLPFVPDAPSTTLRQVLLSGDWIPLELPAALRKSFPAAQLLALGGPTETTVWTNIFRVGEVDPAWSSIPYGRPLSHVRWWVLDPMLSPCAIGSPGEIFVAGVCLATGYAAAPAATAERFVPDPWSPDPGGRIYRTGDRARYRFDGVVEILGRSDHQVKLRGFRVELGEIESTLRRHPDVEEAVAGLRRDLPGGGGLAAWVLPAGPGAEELPARLIDFLRGELPDYMVPAVVEILDGLPVTARGKIDRRALLERRLPVREPPARGVEGAPESLVEELLAEIWHDVLEVEELDRHDDFFQLGGHSLLATRVISRVRTVFGLELSMPELFNNPTLAGLGAWIGGALRGDAVEVPSEPLVATSRGGVMPLSFAQERLWFLDRIEPGSPAYNIAAAIRIAGELDVAAFSAALAAVVERHETLRCHFEAPAGEPHQVISASFPGGLAQVDLRRLPTERRRSALERLANDEANRPFDLVAGPLLRTLLVLLDRGVYRAYLTLHHIIADAWSMEILIRELATLYGAARAGQPSPLAPLPVQYADFAVWQRRRLRPEVIEGELAWWRRNLEGLPPLLELPTDRPRPAVARVRSGELGHIYPAPLAAQLRQLGRRHGTSLFMTVLAGLTVLLHQLTAQRDVGVGSPVAGRTHVELEGMIGFFVNTLVLRSTLVPGASFRDHLRQIRETCLAAFAHQEVPFERLVAELRPERTLSHTPLFQAMLTFARHQPLPTLAGLEVEPCRAGRGGARMGQLTLAVEDRGDELGVVVAYNLDLFDATTLRRWFEGFGRLLAAAALDPGREAVALDRLSPAERHQTLTEWNDTACGEEGSGSRGFSVLGRIEAVTASRPDAVALIADAVHLSYGELERRAVDLAGRLAARGVGRETLAAVCLERSPDLVVALLAVWKAGGAWLPLDPSAPPERRTFVLDDAAAVALVTARAFDDLPPSRAAVVHLDEPAAAPSLPPEPLPAPHRQDAQALAYVIYTSGSTGRPKGVLIEHRGVSNVVASFVDTYRLGPQDRVLQQTAITFDVAVNEIFPVLSVGGAAVLVPPREVADPPRLLARVADQRVTVLGAAPSLLARLDEAAQEAAGGLGALRLVLSGGEALTWSDVKHLASAVRVTNGYGPTEATVCALACDLGGLDPGGRIPLGRPLRNTEAWVLAGSRVLGIGEAGELALGGAGLARGYLGRPRQTAEVFVPHPLGDGERLYLSGDLVRRRADGRLDFLGRIDRQVKVRGFRIELGEVEAALLAHPAVREAAVIDRLQGGERGLVAYVVIEASLEESAQAELRRELETRLPSYMVPAAFVTLDALPLLAASGKVDREALPAPQLAAQSVTGGERVGPRDEVERRLVTMFEELLEQRPISIDADFFALGGHSLLAVRLVRRINKELGKSVPVAALFQEPTVERLAALLRQETVLRWSPIEIIQDGAAEREGRPPFFCVHPLGGEAIAYHRLAERLGEDQPFYALRAPLEVVVTRRAISVEETAAHYIEAMRRVQPEGPYYLGGYSYGCVVTFEMAQQLRRAGVEVALVALLDGMFLGSRLREAEDQRAGVLWQRVKAALAYRPQTYPGRLTFFLAENGSPLKTWMRVRRWRRLSGEPMELLEVDGDHLRFLQEPHVGRVAELLRRVIDAARVPA